MGKIAAEQFSNQPTKAKKILKLSAHWIRHQSATTQDLADIPEEHIQHNLRHSKRDTTRLYVHTYDKARHASMRNFKIR